MTMVVLSYAFLSRERAPRDLLEEPGLPPLSRLATLDRRELCNQELMDERGDGQTESNLSMLATIQVDAWKQLLQNV